jgi:hypothetical protein
VPRCPPRQIIVWVALRHRLGDRQVCTETETEWTGAGIRRQ